MQVAAIARKTNNSSVQNNWYLMLFEKTYIILIFDKVWWRQRSLIVVPPDLLVIKFCLKDKQSLMARQHRNVTITLKTNNDGSYLMLIVC